MKGFILRFGLLPSILALVFLLAASNVFMTKGRVLRQARAQYSDPTATLVSYQWELFRPAMAVVATQSGKKSVWAAEWCYLKLEQYFPGVPEKIRCWLFKIWGIPSPHPPPLPISARRFFLCFIVEDSE